VNVRLSVYAFTCERVHVCVCMWVTIRVCVCMLSVVRVMCVVHVSVWGVYGTCL
jgi:hypothetical protein